MNISPKSRPEKRRDNKNYLLNQQTADGAILELHSSRATNLCGCISPENHSQ
jgi:hypothetical protein